MPKVGNKEYKYTKSGIKAAKRAAKASGQKVVQRKTKKRNEYV